MRNEIVKTDITVIGDGFAGVCAAIAAAPWDKQWLWCRTKMRLLMPEVYRLKFDR
jgi:succinate dehydrogenase/fumarate reductase flavoprotein subunit